MSADTRILRGLSSERFVSGPVLARALGVSRAAVSQRVARLVARGVDVHRVRGRGYRLAAPLSLLDQRAVHSCLKRLGGPSDLVIEIHDELDGTNEELKRRLASGRARVDACLAEHQTRGRGRLGRPWLAAPYQSVLLSCAHELVAGPATVHGLSLAVGVAVARALEAAGLASCALKWPNDLFFGERKLGGVLIEILGELGGGVRAVIGVGVNVRLPESFAARCASPVVDLETALGRTLDRNELAASILASLCPALDEFNRRGFEPFVDAWQRRHLHRGRWVRVERGRDVVHGVALGVDGAGSLRLRDADGVVHRVGTGEVQA